jgi:guanylate kinase
MSSETKTAHARKQSRGLMLMVVAPSGVGKTSLSRRLVADHGDLTLSISATTREPRPGEHDGRDYHFMSRDRFAELDSQKAFLEQAEVYENRYGSLKAPVEKALSDGNSVLFDIDYQGAMNVRSQAPEDSVLVYVLPPSLAEMKRRLHARSQDSLEVIERRLARAKDEIVHWDQFDYVLLNDDFDRAYADLAHIYHSEKLRRSRNLWLEDLVGGLMTEQI